jgi:aspartyl-tRNA(Asn)/glutamyl-tRNA(Gln) amidotransferase subunit A
MDKPLHALTLAEASRRIAQGKLTSSALVEASLARIRATNPSLDAFVLLTENAARRAAKKADRMIRDGKRLGPLHGIPIGLKDIYSTKGVRTTAHSKLLIDNVPAADSTVAAKLAAAGAIMVGKLATHEFATGGPATNLPFPPSRNPWNREHFTGGSSSGSGAAVAAGMVPMAMGSDTSGSIRGPAAYCGIAGHKPTYGLVSRRGVVPLAFSLDHCGPLAWTAEDCALTLDAIAGHDPADPASVDAPAPKATRGLKGGIEGLRLGVVRNFHERDLVADAEAGAAFDDALKVLRRQGAKLKEIALPPAELWDAACRVILYAEAYAIHEKDLQTRPKDYARITRIRLLSGAAVSAADYIQALRLRAQLARQYMAALDGLDAIVCACSLGPAPAMKDALGFPPVVLKGRLIMAPFNMTGAPALSVCAGFAPNGLPLSIQFAARPFEDATVLRLGHAYERATPWREHRPEI